MTYDVLVRSIGLQTYTPILHAMQTFTTDRQSDTPDELWVLEHQAVYTQGQAGKPEHILFNNAIPVVQSDRGGQVTYHGPGQIVVYILSDLKRMKIGVRELVTRLENSVVSLLDKYQVLAFNDKDAPGVYVQVRHTRAKIASLGLRIRKGCSYHGVSLNVDVDLTAFKAINPCGYQGLDVINLATLLDRQLDMAAIKQQFVAEIIYQLGYNQPFYIEGNWNK